LIDHAEFDFLFLVIRGRDDVEVERPLQDAGVTDAGDGAEWKEEQRFLEGPDDARTKEEEVA